MRKLKFPEVFEELKIDRELSSLEMQKIKEGKQPSHQDDKWVIYFQDPWLYFHRFLTGNCIYKIHVVYQDSSCKVDKIFVNGNSDQYKFNEERELDSFLELFDLFLNSKI